MENVTGNEAGLPANGTEHAALDVGQPLPPMNLPARKPHVVIVGCSGHARVIVDAIEAAGHLKIAGFLDTYKSPGIEMLGYEVIGTEEDIAPLLAARICDFAVVAIGDNWTRAEVVTRLLLAAPGLEFAVVIHPSATVARDVQIGRGTVILAGAVVGTGARIGDFCILNTCSSLDHDSIMMDFASLGPRAVTGGGVRIGKFSALGIGATLSHDLQVANCSVLGAGAVAVRDIPADVVAYGNPARVTRTRRPWDPYLKYSSQTQGVASRRRLSRFASNTPGLKLISCESKEWDRYLQDLSHDFFHTRVCHLIHGNTTDTAWLAVIEQGDRRMVWPYVMRPIDEASELFDITSVYGYPGPLCDNCSDITNFGINAWHSLLALWREQNVVSAFTRFNPILANHEWLARVCEIAPDALTPAGPIPMGSTVVIDLAKDQDTIFKGYHRSVRYNLSRAAREGLETEWDPEWNYLDEFVRVYYGTMQRNCAGRFYLFSAQHFRTFRNLGGAHTSLMIARLRGEVIGATMLIEYGGIVNVYLLGSDERFGAISPSTALFHAVQRWAQGRGNRFVHLGGGRGRNDDDALLHFKRKFSPELRSFFTGRWIVNDHEYTALSQLRRYRADVLGKDIDESFFPLYRSPLRGKAFE